eukprot:GEMP01026664.1.p1 GENE.GEMP01026664.1~~GEMP01026664.1.p1  ORF type:complete len:446 (+),score=24.40 GEMP01026664.1:88-1338(+)
MPFAWNVSDHFTEGKVAADGVMLQGSHSRELRMAFDDIAGATMIDGSCVITYCPRGKNGLRTTKLVTTDEESFLNQLRPHLPRPDHFLVLINPASGSGNAQSTWTNIAKPLFDAAQCTYDAIVTTRPLEGTMIAETYDLDNVKAIVIVSGDGLVFEALQGLRARGALVPLAHIHGGSGNALVSSLLYQAGENPACVVSAALMVVRGDTRPLDLFRVESADCSVDAFLSLTWGIISDIDLESEKLRCLSDARFLIWGLWRVVALRKYFGELYYLPPETAGVLLPPLAEPLPKEFQKVDVTEFTGVSIVNLPMLSSQTLVSPETRQADGSLYIIVIRHCGRWQTAQILANLDDASYLNHPNVQVIRCTAFRLLPKAMENVTKLTVDGEAQSYGPVQGEILPSNAQVIAFPTKESRGLP